MSMFISDKKADQLGRWWPWHLLGACLCFPAALATMAYPALTAVPQTFFAWFMCLGSLDCSEDGALQKVEPFDTFLILRTGCT
jgi:hypothetical protein